MRLVGPVAVVPEHLGRRNAVLLVHSVGNNGYLDGVAAVVAYRTHHLVVVDWVVAVVACPAAVVVGAVGVDPDNCAWAACS